MNTTRRTDGFASVTSVLKTQGEICEENWPRKNIGTWKGTRSYPNIAQEFDELVRKKRAEEELQEKFEELVTRKRAEERKGWARKEGPMSRCDYCNTVPDNRLKTCSRCKSGLYCNSFCKRRHWPAHKLNCKRKLNQPHRYNLHIKK